MSNKISVSVADVLSAFTGHSAFDSVEALAFATPETVAEALKMTVTTVQSEGKTRFDFSSTRDFLLHFFSSVETVLHIGDNTARFFAYRALKNLNAASKELEAPNADLVSASKELGASSADSASASKAMDAHNADLASFVRHELVSATSRSRKANGAHSPQLKLFYETMGALASEALFQLLCSIARGTHRVVRESGKEKIVKRYSLQEQINTIHALNSTGDPRAVIVLSEIRSIAKAQVAFANPKSKARWHAVFAVADSLLLDSGVPHDARERNADFAKSVERQIAGFRAAGNNARVFQRLPNAPRAVAPR